MAKRTEHGFTLLEVMVSLSIMAIALTALLASQSQSLSLASEAKFCTTAALLAQSKIAEIEVIKPEDLRSDSGVFGEDFSNYQWDLKVNDVSFAGKDNFPDFLKQIDLEVSWGENKQYQYRLRHYRFVP